MLGRLQHVLQLAVLFREFLHLRVDFGVQALVFGVVIEVFVEFIVNLADLHLGFRMHHFDIL